jgi:hypothetical protein
MSDLASGIPAGAPRGALAAIGVAAAAEGTVRP